MGLFSTRVPEPLQVEIPPGVDLGASAPAKYDSKLKAALAYLGTKWCLASTRAAQIQQIKDNAEDLA
jgi:hypothetical protein